MRISCPKDDLLQRLQVVSRGVSQRSSVQILSGVLIDAASAEAPVAARGDRHGALGARPARAPTCTSRVASSCPGGCCSTSCATCRPSRSSLASGDGPGLLTLECGASRYSLHTYDPDDFPRLADVDHGRTFGVDREHLPRGRRARSARRLAATTRARS